MGDDSTGAKTDSASVERVRAAAAALGLDVEIRRMDASTRTAEDAAKACDCSVAQIIKSLVFENKADASLALLLVSGIHNVDLQYLSTRYGLSFKRADIDRVRRETGFAIGGVAPIGHMTALPVYLDETLLAYDRCFAAAGRPDSVFAVSPVALRDACNATVLQMQPA